MPTRLEQHFGDRVLRCFTPRPPSLNALLDAAVARHPAGEALVAGALRLDYAGLGRDVERVAAGLAALGIGRGDRVAMLLGNRAEFVILLFAITRLGAIAVPISIREQLPGITYLLGHCGAALIVFEDDLAARLPAAADVPDLRRRVAMGDFARLRGDGPAPAVAVAEEDVALLLYTSGTTGRPKGAMLTHLGLVHSVLHSAAALDLTSADRAIVAVPMSHVTGIVPLIAAMVHVAGTLIVLENFKARVFLDLAVRERLTYTVLVPAMYALCLREPDFAAHDLASWRIGAFGGAPMPEATIARLAETLPALSLVNAYGATETTSPATFLPLGAIAAHPESVGRAVTCGEIVVMDEAAREVAPGEVGELWIRGPMVVPGYWNDEAATRAGFTAGFWRSGDIGAVDAEGYVRVLDRSKDMINRGGYKVFSVEVENALSAHEGVLEAAVIGVPCPVLGERVHAVIQPRAAGLGAETLRAHCAGLLADYKVPDFFTFIAEPLPRNANGKVQKRELRSRIVAAPSRG